MSVERIRKIGEKLREFADFAQGDYISVPVQITQEKEFDLGAFGYRDTEVTVEDESYQLDADVVLGQYPINSGAFLELAEELEEYEAEETLDSVLARMETTEPGLVQAVRAIIQTFRATAATAVQAIVPLPPKPLPWPGALRDDIDYTAPDFPLRYQPPPGYDWAMADDNGTRVPYDAAQCVGAAALRQGVRKIVLDNKGRVTWARSSNQVDPFTDGIRWSVWYLERDGISAGTSFTGSTWPRALDDGGRTLAYDEVTQQNPEQLTDAAMWGSETAAATGRVRTRQILALFGQDGAPSSVGYDPLTVQVADVEVDINTAELRLGDDITGTGFGRVISVTRRPDGRCVITMNRDGTINVNDEHDDITWMVLPIIGVDREAQPTALSLSVGSDYDPLTVPLVVTEGVFIESVDLRLGDDILGPSFGRVVAIEGDEIVMNRDGTENRTRYQPGFTWEVNLIDVPNRDSLPTAASLQAVPAPF